ncbi:MAG: alpha/beta hydrolase [Actinobacteria bacterium]|nr:alpha/beta hydrolase [Actinomycetota bacterium]
MPTATLNGTALHYELVGSGPTCLVLHGWPGTDHTYLRPGLDRLGEELRLVYCDHRGHGRSDRSATELLSLEQLADDADALADHLGAERVLVMGHAHGASVALELALRHPGRVAGLILVAATPGDLGMGESLIDNMDTMPTPPEVEVLQRVPPATDDELEATMGGLAHFFFHGDDDADPETVFALSTFNASAAAQLMAASNWWSAVDRLGELQAPVLLLVGRHDVFYPPAQSERIQKRAASADMTVLEQSGHLPWVEEPDAFAESIRAWLLSVRSG